MVDDCYFFLSATCVKGAECPFRHSEEAKSNHGICPQWMANACMNEECPLRHSTFQVKNRAEIECYWQRHGGCRKSDCPFLHSTGEKEREEEKNSFSTLDSSLLNTQSSLKTVDTAANAFTPATRPSIVRTATTTTFTTSTTTTPVQNVNSIIRSKSPEKRPLPMVDTKKLTQSHSLDFEVKSFDEIMKEKRQKRQELESPKDKEDEKALKGKRPMPQVESPAVIESKIIQEKTFTLQKIEQSLSPPLLNVDDKEKEKDKNITNNDTIALKQQQKDKKSKTLTDSKTIDIDQQFAEIDELLAS